VLATTTYNCPNPVLIDDPNLSDFQPCSGYYTNGHSLQFTPNTDTIDLKVTAYYDANVPEAAFYIDNIELEVAEAPKVAFYYNDRGQRVRKESYDNNGNTFKTIYVREPSGSTLAIYNLATGPTVQQPETLKELPIYGTDRLGVYYKDNSEGTYAYQISDHLGNVRAVMIKDGNNALSLTNKTDYYPFGMPMPERNVEGNYRYGYQGEFAEKDPETGKEAFELRLWDSRIGRWMSPDPAHEFFSSYLGMGNNPIVYSDPRGGKIKYMVVKHDDGSVELKIIVSGKAINKSSLSDAQFRKKLKESIATAQKTFKKQYYNIAYKTDNIDSAYKRQVKVSIEFHFETVNSIDDISSDDHVIGIVNEIKGDHVGRAILGGNALIVEKNYLGGNQNVLAHEIGHWFDLDDCYDDPDCKRSKTNLMQKANKGFDLDTDQRREAFDPYILANVYDVWKIITSYGTQFRDYNHKSPKNQINSLIDGAGSGSIEYLDADHNKYD
jgi:RHS repeat-associated protein